MTTIFCLNKISPQGLNLLTETYSFVDTHEKSNAILVRSTSMHDLDLGNHLYCIARAGAGVNNIPIDQCNKKGIVVFNTPGANANGVKELVIASLLLSCRDFIGGIHWCKEHIHDENITKTTEKEKKQFIGHEISGKTLAVLGLGAIGSKVANTAISLGMNVIGYDPYISVNAAWNLSSKVIQATDIESCLKNADFITLHLPLLDQTKEMINDDYFNKMKKGAILLNFSRDSLVNEDDLSSAIEQGILAKYVTDFPNPTVINLKNTIVLPHLGASTEESEDNCAIMAVQELIDYIEHGTIKNSVNFPSCDMGTCTSVSRVAILHQNIPNMIGQITQVLAKQRINIDNLVNNSKDMVAYTLMDLAQPLTPESINELHKIKEILKLRIVK